LKTVSGIFFEQSRTTKGEFLGGKEKNGIDVGDKKESKLAKKEEGLIRIPLSLALLYIFQLFLE